MNIYDDYLPQPLPVYKENSDGDRARWNRNQCHCEGVETFDGWRLILTKEDDSKLDVPVFHIKRDSGGDAITELRLKSVDGTVDFELTGFSTITRELDSPLTKEAVEFLAQTYINIQAPLTDQPLVIDDKEFYLWITDGTNVWYTETFYTLTKDSTGFPEGCQNCKYIRLSYVNSGCIVQNEDGIGVVHNNTPSFDVFLSVNMARPEYDFEPEGQEDGQGGTARTFLRVDKAMGFFVVAPEYIADVLAMCQVMQTVVIEFPNGDSITCKDVAVTVEWAQPEPITNCYAGIDFRFRAASWIRPGCC